MVALVSLAQPHTKDSVSFVKQSCPACGGGDEAGQHGVFTAPQPQHRFAVNRHNGSNPTHPCRNVLACHTDCSGCHLDKPVRCFLPQLLLQLLNLTRRKAGYRQLRELPIV